MRPSILIAALLPLAGCGDAGDSGGQATTPIKAASPYVAQMRALSPLNRGLALRRAIQDSGERCKKIESSAYQQEYKNMAMWTAHCSDTGDWALFIAPNADVQVRACADAAQLKLPACRSTEPQPS